MSLGPNYEGREFLKLLVKMIAFLVAAVQFYQDIRDRKNGL